ncbi:MAG: TatD family hydrolase, partial [Thaumarchaeota archaeon]|nr:TatD family hydrolase [Nitrososphaerota archaeon]
QKGMYVSFGPSILYSRRLGELARISNSQLTLIETDAPTRFEGITGSSPGTPFLAASVIFKLGMLRGSSFLETLQLTSDNALRYLKTQH